MSQSILLIDNYDSFVHNLARYLRLLGCETHVVRSDEIQIAEIVRIAPTAIVISPGPKAPAEAGISLEVVQRLSGKIPILGVCLGHQTIGQAFSGLIEETAPVHGRSSLILHDGSGVFVDVPSPLSVARYHSLIISRQAFPDCLQVTAETEDGIIMAVQHRQHLTVGLQFHPESVLSDSGANILANFLELSRAVRV